LKNLILESMAPPHNMWSSRVRLVTHYLIIPVVRIGEGASRADCAALGHPITVSQTVSIAQLLR
jgi:hypothetical protein